MAVGAKAPRLRVTRFDRDKRVFRLQRQQPGSSSKNNLNLPLRKNDLARL